jgi:hypothetical protein
MFRFDWVLNNVGTIALQMANGVTPREINVHLRGQDSPPGKARLEVWALFLKAILWPVIIAFLLIFFRAPVSDLVNQLPAALSRSDELSFAGLTVKLKQAANAQGNPELADLIGNLSPRAVETLMRMDAREAGFISSSPDNTTFYIPAPDDIGAYLELEKAGLVKFTQPLAEFVTFFKSLGLKPNDSVPPGYQTTGPLQSSDVNHLARFSYKLTDKGAKAKNLIIDVITPLLKKSDAAPP